MDDRKKQLQEAANRLRSLQNDFGPADEPELTEALGDSPNEDDLAIVSTGARRRKRSALTRTA